MGTVHIAKPRNHPGYLNSRVWPGIGQHTRGRRVGVLGMHVQCEDCGQVCTPSHQPYVLSNPNWTEDLTVPGAWLGPPGDPLAHFYPMAPTEVPQTGAQDNINAQAETLPATSQHPAQRPVSFTAAMRAAGKANRRNRPSRTPEARRAERERAARRKALAAVDG